MTRILALALAALLPAAALGQESAPELQTDPRAAKFRDVERGLFVGFEAGYLSLLDTPTKNTTDFPYAGKGGGRAGGLLVTASVGIDLGTRLSVSLFGVGTNQQASIDYGAFSLFGGGADVRWAFYGSKDPNDYERFFLFVHARGSYVLAKPTGLFGDSELLVAGGPGVEYYTRLRHFSIGVVTDVAYATSAGTAGFAVYPTVRYTF
ncbi:MAG: adventurous gliding motility protein CglE [Anaeromyxobacteraceae bacterium]